MSDPEDYFNEQDLEDSIKYANEKQNVRNNQRIGGLEDENYKLKKRLDTIEKRLYALEKFGTKYRKLKNRISDCEGQINGLKGK